MSEERPDPRLLARLLRQRAEMGAGPLFLEEEDRRTLLRAARALLQAAETEAGAAPGSAAGTSGGAARPAGRPAASGGGDATSDPPRGLDAVRRVLEEGRDATPPGPSSGPSRRRVASPDLPVLEQDYEALREMALSCTRCGLAEGRTQVVFSDGVPHARVVVIGEAPGANEDRTGLPFVGAAGRMLDLMLASVDLSRERNTYICNVLKCRPPGNRNPQPDEIEACTPFLRRQLQLVSPDVLLGVGTFAAQWLTGRSETLGKLRGEVHSYEGVPAVVTYHPAALLRNPGWTRAAWDDLQLLRRIADGG